METFLISFFVLAFLTLVILITHTMLTLLLPQYLETPLPTLVRRLRTSEKISDLILFITVILWGLTGIAMAVGIIACHFGMLA